MPDLNMAKPTFRCRCGKYFCMSLEDAKRMRKHVAKRKGRQNPVRYYQCRFKSWHWTSRVEEREKSDAATG